MKHLYSMLLVAGIATLFPFQSVAQTTMSDMEYYGHHIYLKSDFSGKVANFVFDTGADMVYVDSTFLAVSGLKFSKVGYAMLGGVGGKQQKVKMIFDDAIFRLYGKEYKPKMTPIIQLKPILGDKADGLFGIKDLGGKAIIIDYANEKIDFVDQLSAPDVKGFVPVDIEIESNRIYLPISISVDDNITITGKAMMDLGSGHSISISTSVANRYNLNTIKEKFGIIYEQGGIGGKSSSWQFRAKKSTIASFDMNDIIIEYSTDSGGALSGKSGHIGLIGNKVWERFYVIIDLKNKRLYLKPNALFNKESNFNALGFTFTDRSKTLGCWVVNGLFNGSEAERAGLKGGDRILEFNGRDVKTISEVEQKALYEKAVEVKLKVESPQRKSVKHLIIK
jgi:hypothetical protein